MMRAAHDGVHVINLSLGLDEVDGVVPPTLEAAVTQIRSLDNPPAIVASAGNNGDENRVYQRRWRAWSPSPPCGLSRTLTSRPPRARTGPRTVTWVTCSAVGEGIVSTFVKGQEDPQFGGSDVYPQDSWAVWSGTSFAAPQIAALIAKQCRTGMSPLQAVAAPVPAGPPAAGRVWNAGGPAPRHATQPVTSRGFEPGRSLPRDG